MNKIKEQHYHYDLVIIGSGGSGLTAAIHSALKNMNTAVITKVHPMNSHTVSAQGGINAALGNVTEDNWLWHAYDTIKSSDWLADQDSVEMMCKNANRTIEMLDKMGVMFNKTANGMIDQKVYGGQTSDYGKGALAYRTCYSSDKTGLAIMSTLYKKAIKLKKIDFFIFNFAIELIIENYQCYGVVTWDIQKGNINIFTASNVIIATGGFSQIYYTNTSSNICTGDGNALAIKAGIDLQDMEFIQFHPTTINKLGILVTEAARSAGGILLNSKNERFMYKYAPQFLELASRDVIARAIANEILMNRGCGENKDHVLLDLTNLRSEYIKNNLPNVEDICKLFLNIDPSVTAIPIAPSAHYTMGGIPTNKFCQVLKTYPKDKIINGLYALGESASLSVHGANRLGCNSLLDLIVFAEIVINHITVNQKKHQCYKNNITINSIITNFKKHFKKSYINVTILRDQLKSLIQKHLGILRCEKNLIDMLKSFNAIKMQYLNCGVNDKSLLWNSELQEYLELGNMIISAEASIYSALWRKESRGAHSRIDYPLRDDNNFLYHTIYLYRNKKCIGRNVRTSKIYSDIFKIGARNY